MFTYDFTCFFGKGFPLRASTSVVVHQSAKGTVPKLIAFVYSVCLGRTMAGLVRTGLSLEQELLDKFDESIAKRGYQNRSEAVRDLIREHLVSEEGDQNKPIAGTLTLVFDHHRPNLTERLSEIQRQAHAQVLAATHVHLDHHNCLEVIIMKGRSAELRKIADQILRQTRSCR